MAMQLPTGNKLKPGSDNQFTARNRREHDKSANDLRPVRFYKPEFLFQDSGVYADGYAYIKGYN